MAGYKKILVLLDLSEDSEQVAVRRTVLHAAHCDVLAVRLK